MGMVELGDQVLWRWAKCEILRIASGVSTGQRVWSGNSSFCLVLRFCRAVQPAEK